MEHYRDDGCPMCGSLMGAEARPAAMRTRAEILDQLDRLERCVHDAEAGIWRVSTVETVCGPCRETLIGVDVAHSDAVAESLRRRAAALRTEMLETLRRSA
jgi:hypothetical protein